jgi:hypothetical protein
MVPRGSRRYGKLGSAANSRILGSGEPESWPGSEGNHELGANRELASCPFPHYRANTARDGWYAKLHKHPVAMLEITLRDTV